jgi:tRNA (cmo5U34)-methyltransferase
VNQFHFDPASYEELIRTELPYYDELQERVLLAAAERDVERILDLGAGTGVTAARMHDAYPRATIVAVDVSEQMLARIALPDVETHVARLQDPLPAAPFDLAVSVLAIHHLDGAEKRDLFTRVHDALRPGGRFVVGDVVAAAVSVAPLSDGYDKPDRAADQIAWLQDAGFDAWPTWESRDAAVVAADRA